MLAARARLARIRNGDRGGRDSGFALVFVLLVTSMIMIAVGTSLTVTGPNILAAKHDQDVQAAVAAAEAGIDDVVAYLSSVTDCRSTTKVCPQALGASSTTLNRTPLAGTNQSVTWRTDSTLTADQYVRVHSTGTADGVSRSLVGDVALAPSILSFGYYTDYESQAPNFLYGYFDPRTLVLSNSTTYSKINTITVSSPTTVHWNGPATSGTNPAPASLCGQHWYYNSASSPGRYTYGSQSIWGESGTINGSNLTRSASCDVVFTTGMTFDGPVYTRDAMFISDGTVGGAGPMFTQPVSTLWGFSGYSTPAPGSTPWRKDPSVGGNISGGSKAPTTAAFDLTLPPDIGTTGLPTDYCTYTGPTRVKLNGDGTATVTSPQTTSRAAASDPDCYPTGSLAGGIVSYTLPYTSTGSGVVYVKDLGTKPASGWPSTGTKSTIAATPTNSIFYLSATGGATAPDQPETSAATDATCSGTVKYASTASAPCAWTNVATTTDGGSSLGWSATTFPTTTKCNVPPPATDRQLFECEYSHTTTATTPPANQYGALRALIQSDLATGSCLAGTMAAQQTCLANLVNARLQTANTGGHAANYASPASGDHQYLVTANTTGTSPTPVTQSVGAVPSTPVSGDSMFATNGTPTAAQETVTKTPITLKVSRQTAQCFLGCSWANSTPQFTVTVTQSNVTFTPASGGSSYFPDTDDVTQYNAGTAGSTGSNGPGDLYVEGNNQGKLSLIAQNDVIVTNDLKDTSTDPTADAVDLVAGQNVRNYHPVSCVDQTAADINGTTTGFCPNDITGLYQGAGLETNGVLSSSHPAMQYTNMTTPIARRVDAAIFALSGSFLTDNYNRGVPLGTLTVNGGLYQSHRGANGTQWEYQTSDTKRATSGYSLQYHYVDLQHYGLPYAPPATGGSNSRVWNVVSISSGP